MKNEHEYNMKMAKESGQLLPETKDKVEHYEDVLRAESKLLERLKSRQYNIFIKKITKAREKVEIVEIKNRILNKTKIYESYFARKKKYENWLNEMSVEVNSQFDNVLKEAKEIKTNIRLINAIKDYESRLDSEDSISISEKVEFYLYLQQEIKNKKKYGNKKRK